MFYLWLIWVLISPVRGDSCVGIYQGNGFSTIVDLDSGATQTWEIIPEGELPTMIKWSASRRSIAYSRTGFEIFIYSLETHSTQTLVLPDEAFNLPLVDFSPGSESYIFTAYVIGDFYSVANIYDRAGTLLWSDVVTSGLDSPMPLYAWVNDYQILVSASEEYAIDHAVLLDLETGESRIIHRRIWDMVLSPDSRLVAIRPDYNNLAERDMRYIYDLERNLSFELGPVEFPLGNMVWSPDSRELLFLSQNKLIGYRGGEWRDIAAVEGGYTIEVVPCSP